MIVECPGCKSRYDLTGRPPGTTARCRCGKQFELPRLNKEAGNLSCPSCGGAVSPMSPRCEFCQSDLLLKACPRCFCRVFHKSKHCNRCGAEVSSPAEVTESGEARIRECPRCDGKVPLVARFVGDTLLDECPSCQGVWVDQAAVSSLIADRKRDSFERTVGMASAPLRKTMSLTQAHEKMYLSCPDCSGLMNRVNFAKRSGILIDVCRQHGTWFDANELPAVIGFVSKGGLVESAEKDRIIAREKNRTKAARGDIAGISDWDGPAGSPLSHRAADIRFERFSKLLTRIAIYLFS